ncbi:MAG TPA: tetratricopeptide repeat-containing diguanylate cyclase [Steroidobacteraceae bacterium]|nr:tetratricopeptide repeat-containing diguanylate cyclase [Steroidobacteraceae bacterium]
MTSRLAMLPATSIRSRLCRRLGARLALGLLLAIAAAGLLESASGAPAEPAVTPHPAITLIERGVIEMRTDPEASRRDAESALQVLQRQPDADLEIQARLILCDYQAERDTHAAQEQIAAALTLLPKAHRKGIQAGLLDCRGEISETAGDNSKARELYEQAVAVATGTHDDEMLAQSLFSRGYLLGLQGEYAAGLADLKRAQSLFDRLSKPLHSLTTLNSIAILYNRMGDYASARAIYSRALTAQRKAGMTREVVVTLHNLGRASENLHDWEGARQSFTESLALSRQLGYVRGEAYALRGLAAVANGAGDPKAALETLDRATDLQKQTPDARLLAQIDLARGVALHKLQRLAESAAALESALQIFLRADALGELNATYSELAQVYSESGNWRAAFERQTQAKQISDRLLTNQLDQRFATLKVEFDTAAKEKENAALMRENEANQKALAQGRAVRSLQATVIVLSATLVIVLALVALYQRRSSLRMRFLAMTDELTGVPNRRAVLRRLEPLLRDSQAEPCCALIIDIDHFKRINDQLGHPTGDEVLKVVAARVRSTVTEPAFFGRLGGEEFLIVLPQTTLERARAAGESLREQILSVDTARWFDDRRNITASIGCTVSNPGLDTASTMLKRADAALYVAKRSGRNCVRTEPAAQQELGPLLIETQ